MSEHSEKDAMQVNGSAEALPSSEGAELFVGREPELSHLRDALRLAVEGSGRMDMLVGEPGIGKTRLAEELAVHAERTGVRPLLGRCYESSGQPAYWLWIQVLRNLWKIDTSRKIKEDQGRSGFQC